MKKLNVMIAGLVLATAPLAFAETAKIPTAKSFKDVSVENLKGRRMNMKDFMKTAPVTEEDEGGNFVGNGGDATINEKGDLILRDFLEKTNLEKLDDSKEFAESVPEFKGLVIEIMKAHPEFGLMVWNQIAANEIWVTESPLPILPAAATAVVGPKAEVQVAIRYGDRIVISVPAFERVNKDYILLHEALHGVVNERGAWKHEAVRAIVKAVRNMRGQMTYQKLTKLLQKNNVYIHGEGRQVSQAGFSAMLLNKDSKTLRCALYVTYQKHSTVTGGLPSLQEFGYWSDYSTCGHTTAEDLFESKYPGYQKEDLEYASIPYIHEIKVVRGTFGTSTYTKNNCQNLRTNTAQRAKLEKAERALARQTSLKYQLQKDYESAKNPLNRLYAKMIFSSTYFLWNVEKKQAELNEAMTAYRNSDQACRSVGL
ncbi:MAG: hypothetical protein AB7H97_18125 [Pseudobdellovibrionaceae bacterium]